MQRRKKYNFWIYFSNINQLVAMKKKKNFKNLYFTCTFCFRFHSFESEKKAFIKKSSKNVKLILLITNSVYFAKKSFENMGKKFKNSNKRIFVSLLIISIKVQIKALENRGSIRQF
jgi:hypothetical protein